MSRRDKYIRAALTALLTNSFNDGQTWDKIAETAVYIADAAIAAADASEPVEAEPAEAEPEAVAEDGEPKVGELCMFRDDFDHDWLGPRKLHEDRGRDVENRYRHHEKYWRFARKATAEEIARVTT
jgi:hypothetical protein